MDIDLSLLKSHTINEINISNDYKIPKRYYQKSNVIDLKNVKVYGTITLENKELDYNEETEYIKCSITGTLVIEDSITLKPIDYDFTITYSDFIEENCKKNKNSLDIFAFLWENIVLEVPIQYTKVKNFNKYHGDGWQLVNEEELINTNNPFKDLLNEFEKE